MFCRFKTCSLYNLFHSVICNLIMGHNTSNQTMNDEWDGVDELEG